MEPLISIRTDGNRIEFQPGELMRFASQVDAVAAEQVSSLEVSVIWRTEGKGDEDLGVHFFQRITSSEDDESDLLAQRQYETVLPRSPVSYEGLILKIRWLIRLRVFMRDGKDFHLDRPFQLGPLPTAANEGANEEPNEHGEDMEKVL